MCGGAGRAARPLLSEGTGSWRALAEGSDAALMLQAAAESLSAPLSPRLLSSELQPPLTHSPPRAPLRSPSPRLSHRRQGVGRAAADWFRDAASLAADWSAGPISPISLSLSPSVSSGPLLQFFIRFCFPVVVVIVFALQPPQYCLHSSL